MDYHKRTTWGTLSAQISLCQDRNGGEMLFGDRCLLDSIESQGGDSLCSSPGRGVSCPSHNP